MPADQVIVIRHAEKPTAKPKRHGVQEDGTSDKESLTVRGWQHAGSLAAIFGGAGSHPTATQIALLDDVVASRQNWSAAD